MANKDTQTPSETPLIARDEKGTPVQIWTQEQIEAAILTYGADDIDCCIQNQGEHIARLQAELAAERAGWIADQRENMDVVFDLQRQLNEANARASDAAAVAYERAAKVVAGAAPGFCGGKAETVLYTIAAELRSLIPDAARVEAVLLDSMNADRKAAKKWAEGQFPEHYGPDVSNLAAAYLELIAEYKDEERRWENVFDAQTSELVVLRAEIAHRGKR